MKVYIVYYIYDLEIYCGDSLSVFGIYTSRELAEIAANKNEFSKCNIAEVEVNTEFDLSSYGMS